MVISTFSVPADATLFIGAIHTRASYGYGCAEVVDARMLLKLTTDYEAA